jgi:hypothetical protein
MNRQKFIFGTGIVGAGLLGTGNTGSVFCPQAPQQILQQI